MCFSLWDIIVFATSVFRESDWGCFSRSIGTISKIRNETDVHLQWSKQLAHVQVKLNRGIEILSRLRHNANLKTLKIVYPICGRYQLCIATRAGYHYERLVIFPMSGNNTFEASDFAGLRFSLWSSEGASFSLSQCSYGKIIAKH